MTIFFKPFPKIEVMETFLNSYYETSITLIPQSDKDTTRKENYRSIYLMNMEVKILIKYQETKFNITINSI